jgi:hypothetical protein
VGQGQLTLTASWGTVSADQAVECLASLLAIGDPRGAGAASGAASFVGVFSLEGAGLGVLADLWPRPLLGGRRPRSACASQLTIMHWVAESLTVCVKKMSEL